VIAALAAFAVAPGGSGREEPRRCALEALPFEDGSARLWCGGAPIGAVDAETGRVRLRRGR